MSKVSVCKPSEVKRYASPWGNQHLEVTARDLAELLMGKVLVLKGYEYSIFITFDPEEKKSNEH